MSAVAAVEDSIICMFARRGTAVYYENDVIKVPGKFVEISVRRGDIQVCWTGYAKPGYTVPLSDPDAVDKLMECLYSTPGYR